MVTPWRGTSRLVSRSIFYKPRPDRQFPIPLPSHPLKARERTSSCFNSSSSGNPLPYRSLNISTDKRASGGRRLFASPTSSSQERIRLAVLGPGSSKDPIQIVLATVYTHEVSYTGISYDRSTDLGNVDIRVDGEYLQIPKPLEGAL